MYSKKTHKADHRQQTTVLVKYNRVHEALFVLLIYILIFLFSINLTKASEPDSLKIINYNRDKSHPEVYVSNGFYLDGNIYLNLFNTAKAFTFYVKGKYISSENNKVLGFQYLIVLDSSNINQLVIPAEDIAMIEFAVTNASTKGYDYIYYSKKVTESNIMSSGNFSDKDEQSKMFYCSYNKSFSTADIVFSLKKQSEVRFELYDMSGRKVLNIAKAEFPSGKSSLKFSAAGIPSGIYFCLMYSESSRQTVKFAISE